MKRSKRQGTRDMGRRISFWNSDPYDANIPDEQFGATSGRGTDFATHVMTTIAAIAEQKGWSIFLLFVGLDLSSAAA